MNYMKKIGLVLSLSVVIPLSSAVVSLDTLLQNKSNEAVVRKAILEYIQKHNKVVFCFDAATNVKSFANMQQTITKLLIDYPDVMFVLVDVAKYNYLKEKSSFLRLYKNTSPVVETKMLSHAKLAALLNQHYR
jgi:hypothetical protein